MSNLDPSGPSQPTQQQAYETVDNPATKEPAEKATAQTNRNATSKFGATAQRNPQQQSSSIEDATSTSLGQGIHGAGPGEEAKGRTEEDVGRHNELDAEQMAAPGEGDVAREQGRKDFLGASGAQEGLESDLDRKKAEQAPLREAVQEGRHKNVDVGGVLGQTGGPANPVDKEGYPNKGD